MTTIATVLSAVTQGLYFCSKPGTLTYVSKSSYHRMIFVVVFLTTTKKWNGTMVQMVPKMVLILRHCLLQLLSNICNRTNI